MFQKLDRNDNSETGDNGFQESRIRIQWEKDALEEDLLKRPCASHPFARSLRFYLQCFGWSSSSRRMRRRRRQFITTPTHSHMSSFVYSRCSICFCFWWVYGTSSWSMSEITWKWWSFKVLVKQWIFWDLDFMRDNWETENLSTYLYRTCSRIRQL